MSKEQPEHIEGVVEEHTVLKGTGSEHQGVVLTTGAGEKLRLQRIGGNPFSDPITKSLIGNKVALKGYRTGNVFRFIHESDD
jgi:hypothetical protein